MFTPTPTLTNTAGPKAMDAEKPTNPRFYKALSFEHINVLLDLLESVELTPDELEVKGVLEQIKALMIKRRQAEDEGQLEPKRPPKDWTERKRRVPE